MRGRAINLHYRAYLLPHMVINDLKAIDADSVSLGQTNSHSDAQGHSDDLHSVGHAPKNGVDDEETAMATDLNYHIKYNKDRRYQ